MLNVEPFRGFAVGVTFGYFGAHRDDFVTQCEPVARLGNDLLANRFEGGAGRNVTGRSACAGEGLVLPRPCFFSLIFGERRHRAEQQSRRPVRTQTHVDVIGAACRGHRGQPALKALCNASELITVRDRVVRHQKDQIEIARITQFFAAPTAVRNDRHARLGGKFRRGEQMRKRGFDDRVAQRGKVVGERFQR